MRTFTPAEIDLCKKIAEKERKEISKGDWYFDNEINKALLWSAYSNLDLMPKSQKKVNVIPLWQEHDCLEWLIEKNWAFGKMNWKPDEIYCVWIHHYDNVSHERDGKTLLEALLRAILAIMESK